jgi:hypothetical protein
MPANAAMKYWQAFALMPELSKEQEKKLRSTSSPLDSADEKLIEEADGSLRYLHRGAAIRTCDWSLDYDDGPFMAIPHVEKARTLARLACLRARQFFARGRPNDALADIITTFVFSRHVGADPIFLNVLIQYSIEQSAIEVVALHLGEFDKPLLATLSARMAELPKGPSLADCVLAKKRQVVDWLIGRVEAAASESRDWKEEIRRVCGPDPQVRSLLEAGGDAAGTAKLLRKISHRYEEAAKIAALPTREFATYWHRWQEGAHAADRGIRVFELPLEEIGDSTRQWQTRLALFSAALAVKLEGKQRLNEILDPYDGRPFEYVELPQGFELRSRLVVRGKQVMLTVGGRAEPTPSLGQMK